MLSIAVSCVALSVGSRGVFTPRHGAAHMQASNEVQNLLSANSALVSSLGAMAPDMSEMARLRFALGFPEKADAEAAMRETLAWRSGPGKSTVEAAKEAVDKATAGGGWDNDVVRDAAPHAAVLNEFITPKNILSLSTADGDLVYVIRASAIEDKKMMEKVSVDMLVEFLLYVKEVHSLVVNARSERTGRLCNVIFANDITGTRKAPDPQFSKALTASSKSYEKLYPSLAGPTMILNLPFFLQVHPQLQPRRPTPKPNPEAQPHPWPGLKP